MKRFPLADTSIHIGSSEIHAVMFNRQRGRCWYCGDRLATKADLIDNCLANESEAKWPQIEHQLPRSRGGTMRRSNLVLACVECNFDKGNRTVDEYRGHLSVGLMVGLLFHGERRP